MPLVIKGQDGDFEPAPPGLHQAVCVDVVDLGLCKTNFGDKKQVKIIWQLKMRNAKGDRYQVRQTFTQSLADKSNLRHALETWRGRPFTSQEIMGFDVEKLLGANCQIQVIHRVSAKGRTYANPQAIVPAMKGGEVLKPEKYDREPWPTIPNAQIVDESPDDPADFTAGDEDVPF